MRQQYFETWASYHIPVRRTKPRLYHDLYGASVFYLGVFDAADQLVEFSKLHRTRTAIGSYALDRHYTPGQHVYFQAELNALQPNPSVMIPYDETESLTQFFEDTITAEGLSADLMLVEQVCESTDRYEYWPTGTLRKRQLWNRNDFLYRMEYDQSGREIRRSREPAPATPEMLTEKLPA